MDSGGCIGPGRPGCQPDLPQLAAQLLPQQSIEHGQVFVRAKAVRLGLVRRLLVPA